jgi:hypothetical protein
MARAALVITIGDATIAEGGTGFVDVLIHSDDVLDGDPLQNFGFEFRITTAEPTRLEFVNPQSDPQLTDPNYVFFGDSLAEMIGVGPPILPPNTTFIGGDSTDSFADVTVLTTDKLLARLQLTAMMDLDLPPEVGDTFTISLEPSVNTFFNDSLINPISFSSTPGTVTIGPAATVVPEPGALALFALGSVLLLAKRQGRTRKHRFKSSSTWKDRAGAEA